MWRQIVRKDTHYESLPSPCGRWDCPDCSARMIREWAQHLDSVTKGRDLYVVEAKHEDWSQVFKAIYESRANYVRITRDYLGLTIILDKHIDGAVGIPNNKIREILKKASPTLTEISPIQTSNSWRKCQKTADPMVKPIMRTWLPVYRQKEIAISLGAKLCGLAEWQSPQEADANEWERQLIKGIRECEKSIEEKLNKLDSSDRSTAWAEMFNLDVNTDVFDKYL